MTKIAPAQALLGYLPVLDPLAPPTTRNERIEEQAEQARQSREQAKEALDRAAEHTPEDQFREGDQVWLEARNLALPYQTRKLAPKYHSPFMITKQVSPCYDPGPVACILGGLQRIFGYHFPHAYALTHTIRSDRGFNLHLAPLLRQM